MSVGFNEVWRWDGWTTADETATCSDGAVDSDGNVVMVGYAGVVASTDRYDDTFQDAESGDFAAVKLSSSGEVVWTWTASSSDGEADIFLAVDTDSNNDVFIGGYTHGYWDQSNPADVRQLAVVKLSATGEELWRYQESPSETSSTTIYGDVYYGSGSVLGVAVDGDDNLLLAGQTIGSLVPGEGSNQDSDFFIVKLDGTDGSEIWRMQEGEAPSFDAFHQAEVDSAGDVVAVGVSGDQDQDAINFVVMKLSGFDGTILWEHSPITYFTHDVPKSVDIDAQGDVYVAGGYDAHNLQGDISETPVVLKLSGITGDVIWTYEGTSASRATFHGVAVDPVTGWVVGAGFTEGTWVTGAAAGDFDFAAVLLDGDGNELARYQDGTVTSDSFSFAEFDSAGGLFLGGSWLNVDQDEFIAIKFAPFEVAAPTLAPSPQPPASSLPPSPAPAGENASPSLSPAPTPGSRGGLPTPAPSPAPTSAVAAVAALAEWEIGAIAGGGAFFLLLLGLCEFLVCL